MAIIYGGKIISPSINNLQQTDFSKVTAHPEFVVKGKTFYDETGQLKTGTSDIIDKSTGQVAHNLFTIYATAENAPHGTLEHIIGYSVNSEDAVTYTELEIDVDASGETTNVSTATAAEIERLGASDTVKIYTTHSGGSIGNAVRVVCENCVATCTAVDENYSEWEITVSDFGAYASSITVIFDYS